MSPFYRLPRKHALEATDMEDVNISSGFYKNLSDHAKAQRHSNHRGWYKHNFTDSKYACISAAPNRARTGVTEQSYHKKSVPPGCWNETCETMKCYEKLMCAYAPTGELCRIAVVKKVLNFYDENRRPKPI